jgi:hypothetical protein
MALATLVAWWTTVFPALVAPHGTLCAFFVWFSLASGLVVCAVAGAWFSKTVPMAMAFVVGFAFPATLALVFGDAEATLQFEPLDSIAGILAWATLGLLVMRPEAITPSTHDLPADRPHRLLPRKAYPSLSRVSFLALSAVVLMVVGYRLLSVVEDTEHAILARTALIVIIAAVFSAAGEAGVAIYSTRVPATIAARFGRARWALLALIAFAVLRMVLR